MSTIFIRFFLLTGAPVAACRLRGSDDPVRTGVAALHVIVRAVEVAFLLV
ncbi:hypothetical protein [Phytoactinopolyspora endophytica]|nr:hypothetical protein [Phytoactinopolyspora endophytica]